MIDGDKHEGIESKRPEIVLKTHREFIKVQLASSQPKNHVLSQVVVSIKIQYIKPSYLKKVRRKIMNSNIKHFVDDQFNNQGTYLIIKDKSAILIDASLVVNQAVTYAKENDIKIESMIITHGHLDHILGIDYLLLSFPNVTIYINQWDEDCLFIPNRNSSPRYGKEIKVEKPIKNLVALKGDIELKLSGLVVNIVHIPGHTPGSQYVLIKEYNAAFIGDTIFKDKIGFHGKDMDYCDDKYFKKSLLEISNLEENLDIYPGHHETFVLKDVLKNNKILIDFLKS